MDSEIESRDDEIGGVARRQDNTDCKTNYFTKNIGLIK